MSLPTITEMVAALGNPKYFFSEPVIDPVVVSAEEQGNGFGTGYGWVWGDGPILGSNYEPA